MAAKFGTTARIVEHRNESDLAGVGNSARRRRYLAGRSQEIARRVVAGSNRAPEGNRRIHRKQGRIRIPLRQTVRRQKEGSRGRAVYGRKPFAASSARCRRERRIDRSCREAR